MLRSELEQEIRGKDIRRMGIYFNYNKTMVDLNMWLIGPEL